MYKKGLIMNMLKKVIILGLCVMGMNNVRANTPEIDAAKAAFLEQVNALQQFVAQMSQSYSISVVDAYRDVVQNLQTLSRGIEDKITRLKTLLASQGQLSPAVSTLYDTFIEQCGNFSRTISSGSSVNKVLLQQSMASLKTAAQAFVDAL